MNAKAFIDTNILIYTQRTDNPIKKQIADDVVSHFDCVASTQVLNELANVFTKKYPTPIEKIEYLLKSIRDIFEIIIVDENVIIHALHLHNRYKISYYDSLMIAAAIKADCQYLITEDMNDGLVVENTLKIVNIFSHSDMLTKVSADER